jgi:hypothetical protein
MIYRYDGLAAAIRLRRRVMLDYYERGIPQSVGGGNSKTLNLVTQFSLQSCIV